LEEAEASPEEFGSPGISIALYVSRCDWITLKKKGLAAPSFFKCDKTLQVKLRLQPAFREISLSVRAAPSGFDQFSISEARWPI
jgi:hypothetical protein